LAACVSFPIVAPVGVANAGTCLAAPTGPGPKGSRWHYRLEWPSQRKCWHLVQNDRRPTRAAKAAPQPEADDDGEATPTPAASTPPARTAQPEGKPAQPRAAPAWTTRNASNTDDAGVWPEPPNTAAPPAAEAPAPAQRIERNASPVVAAPTAPQPVAARDTAAASNPDGALSIWRLLFAAIAVFGFAAAAVLVVLEMRRRRTDILNTAMEAEVAPEESPEWPPEEAPTFAPLPPIGVQRGDDIEDALRRFTQSWRRRAAVPSGA
jgi:hypothetical protein